MKTLKAVAARYNATSLILRIVIGLVVGAVLAALICGLAGEILLIWEKNDKFFIPGALSFTLGHGLYALSIFRRTPGMTRSHLITAAVFIAAYIAVVAYMSFRIEMHVDD